MSGKRKVAVRGHVSSGVGHWRVRLTDHGDVFTAAFGEVLYPGTLNVTLPYAVPILPFLRVSGRVIEGDEEDYLVERCRIYRGHGRSTRKAVSVYRVRPYHRQFGWGGHGDHVLEIVSAIRLRDILGDLQDGDPVTVEMYRPDLVGFLEPETSK